MTKKQIHIAFILLFSALIIPSVSHSQSIPLNGMSLQILPRHKDVAEDVGPKTIRVAQSRRGLKVIWYSLVKNLAEGTEYPTYKVKARRGIVETDGLTLKTALFLPNLWGSGYIRSETALPLWMDPAYLEMKGKQKRSFNAGLLNNNKFLLKLAPYKLFDQLSFFQNLYDQYVTGLQLRTDLKLKKSDKKELKKFVREFFFVKKIAKTKATLYVNETKESYPSRIIGNDYYHLVVIDDPLNPLVVNFSIFPDKAPKVFRKTFKQFKKSFEYRITQISY